MTGDAAGQSRRTANLRLNLQGQSIEFVADVPTGPSTVRELLPILRDMTHAVVDAGVRRAIEAGKSISCRAGCGACCSQLVPLNRSEAFVLRDVVARMEEPRKSEVLRRFAQARTRLLELGEYDKLLSGKIGEGEALREFGIRYFGFGIPCPFLEEGSCSIYEQRPLKCREYLVTSPAEHCSAPAEKKVEGVELGGKPANAAMRIGRSASGQSWVPLIVALDWVRKHAEDERQPGTTIFEEFLRQLATAQSSISGAAPTGGSLVD